MSSQAAVDCGELKKLIREVPDFPKKGILFYDITTLLKDKAGFARLIDALSENYIGKEIDLVLGMEARGFIFAPALAYRLNAGFVPVRKPGKLPAETVQGQLRPGIRQQRAGGAQRCHRKRPAGSDCGRSAGHRRNSGRDGGTGQRPGRTDCRPRRLWSNSTS